MAVGRPKKEIDYILAEKLANIMCTQEEIAIMFDCDVRTLQRDAEFCRVFKKGKETGKMSLRRTQWKLAEKNTAMAIWLGKQYLGQKDKVEYTDDGIESINKNIINIAKLINNPKENRDKEDV